MKATDFDQQFDAGKDIIEFLDLNKAKRPGIAAKQIASEVGRVEKTKQSLIKFWVADKLDHQSNH